MANNIELFIGQSSTEGERKRRARQDVRSQKSLCGQTSESIVDICPPEIEIEKEKEIERELKTGQTAHAPLGRYKNVFLSETELAQLQTELPTKWQHYIDRLSEYMASTGKKYQSHLATIRRWAAADGKQTTNIPNYTYEEGESL